MPAAPTSSSEESAVQASDSASDSDSDASTASLAEDADGSSASSVASSEDEEMPPPAFAPPAAAAAGGAQRFDLFDRFLEASSRAAVPAPRRFVNAEEQRCVPRPGRRATPSPLQSLRALTSTHGDPSGRTRPGATRRPTHPPTCSTRMTTTCGMGPMGACRAAPARPAATAAGGGGPRLTSTADCSVRTTPAITAEPQVMAPPRPPSFHTRAHARTCRRAGKLIARNRVARAASGAAGIAATLNAAGRFSEEELLSVGRAFAEMVAAGCVSHGQSCQTRRSRLPL